MTDTWEFDGVVRLTRAGTAYLLFTLVIGFAALNTGNNALYIGLTFMLGCLLLSGLASKGGLKHLEVEVLDSGEAWAGRPAELMLRITNRSRIWNVRDVVITSAEMGQPLLVPILVKRRAVEVPAAFLFRHRGIVQLKTADFYTRYPFGFFLKKRRVRLSGEVVVFPRLLSEDSGRERFQPVTGEHLQANRPGPGSEIHSFRDYVRGDSFRQIYWKKSASLGRWIIKQTDLDAARVVEVVVDPYLPRGASEEAFEEMISAATTFVFHSLRRGLNVVLVLPRVTLSAFEGQSGTPLFRALATIEPNFEPLAPPIGRHSVVFTLRRSDAAASA